MRDHWRLCVLPPRRRAVDDDRVRLAHLPSEADGLLDRFEIEHAGPAGNDDQRCGPHRLGDDCRHVRRRVDEDLLDAVALRRAHHIADSALRDLQRQIFRLQLPGVRRLYQSVSDPCGSASIKRQARDGLCTCAARCAASVLLPEPPLREAKTMTFISSSPCLAIRHSIGALDSEGRRRSPGYHLMPTSESDDSVTTFRIPVGNLASRSVRPCPRWNRRMASASRKDSCADPGDDCADNVWISPV